MKITTNYSGKDWNRAIPNIIISVLPMAFFFWSILFLYIPYIENFAVFLNYQTDDEIVVRFINHVIENEELQTGYLTPDGWFLFFMFAWGGSMLSPLWIFWKFHRIIPVEWIVKKLGIDNRMKLVIFVDGKPLKKFRQLFGR